MNREFIRLAIPNIATNLSGPLAGLVDVALLGHQSDPNQLAGVALGMIIFQYVYWSFSFLRMGTTGLTAIALGAEDEAESAALFFRALALAFGIGVSIWVLSPLIGVGAFALLSGTDSVEQAGADYYYARVLSAPVALGGYAIMGWLLGRQRAGAVLLYSAVLNGCNVVLDYLFIFKFGWGAAGAGWATGAAELIAFLLGLYLVRKNWRDLPGFDRSRVSDWPAAKRLMSLNFNIMIRTFCLISSFALFTNFSAVISTNHLNANSILFQLFLVASYFIDGFAFAVESMAGKYHGARNRDVLRWLLRTGVAWNVVVGLTVAGFYLLAGDWVLSLLTSHQDIIAVARNYLLPLGAVIVIGGVAFILDGFMLGIAAGPGIRNGMLISTLLGFLPMGLWGLIERSNQILWGALILFMLARALSFAWLARREFNHL